jgi:c-di-GMP-binding flagellar brake protein YcgR
VPALLPDSAVPVCDRDAQEQRSWVVVGLAEILQRKSVNRSPETRTKVMERTPRQYPRFKAVLPIELHPASITAPLRAQTQDICLGGLYVEMNFTQKVSTDLEITLWIGDTKISASGVVVSSHPSFGNGVKFTHLPDESKERLQQYLESIERSGIARSITRGLTA